MTSVQGIDHVQIAMPAGGENAARAFYAALLGLREIPKPAYLAARGGLWFRCGELQLHLGVDRDFRPATKAHVGLLVGALAPLLERLRQAGYEIVADDPLPGYIRAFTVDPFGNRIELLERSKN